MLRKAAVRRCSHPKKMRLQIKCDWVPLQRGRTMWQQHAEFHLQRTCCHNTIQQPQTGPSPQSNSRSRHVISSSSAEKKTKLSGPQAITAEFPHFHEERPVYRSPQQLSFFNKRHTKQKVAPSRAGNPCTSALRLKVSMCSKTPNYLIVDMYFEAKKTDKRILSNSKKEVGWVVFSTPLLQCTD